jgi:GTP pyrophosphokinase
MEELEKTKQNILRFCPKKFRKDVASAIDMISDIDENGQKHMLGTASIVAQLGFDTTTIIAAMLHDTDLYPNYSESVQNLVKGVRIIEATTKNEDTKDEIITKYILNNTKDLRSVIIKLASVLDKVRNPDLVNEGYKKIYFKQAQSIYSGIAEYLDLAAIKTEIDERIFKITQPVEYMAIDNKYREFGIDSKLLKKYQYLLYEKTKNLNIQIAGRVKSRYSVYNKLKKYEKEWKSPNIKKISDLVAFRCITKNTDDCFNVLEKIMDSGELNIDLFDDYISNPKPNGYMAIHSVVKFPEISDLDIEIQILTEEMHCTNTYGSASHIAYKASKSRYANPSDKYGWVREVHDGIQRNLLNRNNQIDIPIKANLFQEDIFAFTPKGEIIPLSRGDTALDFAYRIHSQIGDSAVAAKINGKAGKLNQILKTGDIVEIKTQKDKKCHDVGAIQYVNSNSSKNRILKSILKNRKN